MKHEEPKYKFRPKSLDDVVGQEAAVATLKSMLKKGTLPHAIMFCGPSGTGKTTLTMALKKELDCRHSDFTYINVAKSRGIETIRDLEENMNLSPAYGKARIWVLDEFHGSTGPMQQAALNMLEFPPDHAYFFLCTTEPNKVIKTIRHGRCMQITLKGIAHADMAKIVRKAMAQEELAVTDAEIEQITAAAEGSARKALDLLHQISSLPEDDPARADAIESAETKRQGIEIWKALMNRRPWKEVAAILNAVDDEPEKIRAMVLSCASNSLLRCDKWADNAMFVAEFFSDPFYDNAKAKLTIACRQCWLNNK
jgi:DNA polymerase III gamma/tau subunit